MEIYEKFVLSLFSVFSLSRFSILVILCTHLLYPYRRFRHSDWRCRHKFWSSVEYIIITCNPIPSFILKFDAKLALLAGFNNTLLTCWLRLNIWPTLSAAKSTMCKKSKKKTDKKTNNTRQNLLLRRLIAGSIRLMPVESDRTKIHKKYIDQRLHGGTKTTEKCQHRYGSLRNAATGLMLRRSGSDDAELNNMKARRNEIGKCGIVEPHWCPSSIPWCIFRWPGDRPPLQRILRFS